ncbi:MAG: phosphatase PAP2 family protein [Planctomycetaceae bacterium]|nr:phosphatase PAP2 family protein [Planctomycetaceae bacterium]
MHAPCTLSSTWRQAADTLQQQFPLRGPLLLLVAVTLVMCCSSLDLWISGWFYRPESGQWPQLGQHPWKMIDRFFVYPGVVLGVAAIVVASHSLVWRIRGAWSNAALILAGVFLLGPGLLVNGSMKPYFSRPRPKDVVELGGTKAYQPPLGFGDQLHFNSSFPSGHASIGFFLITPAFVFRQQPAWRRCWLLGGLCYGALMSYSRIVQGAHFTSDVLWSLAILYFTSWGVTALVAARELRATAASPGNAESRKIRSAA